MRFVYLQPQVSAELFRHQLYLVLTKVISTEVKLKKIVIIIRYFEQVCFNPYIS